jgi:class 3 adenylate cyclase
MRLRLFLSALLFATAAHSLDFAEYNNAQAAFDLKGHVHYYFEEYNEQQPHEALDLLKGGYFTRSESARLSLGYTRKPVWVAVPFVWKDKSAATFMLEITALIDKIQFNYASERGLILDSSVTGRDYPLSSRALPNHNFVFPVSVEMAATPAVRGKAAGNSETRGIILMRLESQGSMLVPLQLMHEKQFYKTDHIEQLVFGFYFGIMLVMVLYNLFLYASTRERSYAFYVFYILFFALFQFALWGYFHEVVLPESPKLAKYLLPVFLHFATVFQLLFATQFFQAQTLVPKQYKIAGLLSFVTFISLIAGPFLPYRIFIATGIFTGAGAALAIFFMALTLYIKRVKAARYFLIAYTTLIVGVIFLSLRNLGIINYSFISTYSAQIGSALEVILLSLALADKINIWRDEKEKAQKQVIDREREMNRAFQLFVPQKFLELAGETDFTRLELGKSTTRDITILFSDIRGFTALSESMSPEENFRFLNSYLRRMGPIIREHGGFIDKFIGDAIMALFAEDHGRSQVTTAKDGVLVAADDHGGSKPAAGTMPSVPLAEGQGGPSAGTAKDGVLVTAEGQGGPSTGTAKEPPTVRAARAALAMRTELIQYNEHRRAQGYQAIDIGIGIHTGSVRLGTIGENERWEGTVIGDTVNLASRIESLSSTFHSGIVISEALLKELPQDLPARELDTIRVKGKKHAVKVYELMDHDG